MTFQGLTSCQRIHLSNNASTFEIVFPPKCKCFLQDWLTLAPKLIIGCEVVEPIDRFTHLGSLINLSGLLSEGIWTRIQKGLLCFDNLRHLWCRRENHPSVSDGVNCSVVCSVLFYGCGKRTSRVEDVYKFIGIWSQMSTKHRSGILGPQSN